MINSNIPDTRRRGRKPDPAKESFWRELILQQRHSGLRILAFCQRQRVAVSSFHMWRSRLHRRDHQTSNGSGPARFVELRAVPVPAAVAPTAASAPARHDAPLELLLGDDRRLLIRAGCDAALLREVLAAFSPADPSAVSLSKREERSC
jgi:hypothetical protein